MGITAEQLQWELLKQLPKKERARLLAMKKYAFTWTFTVATHECFDNEYEAAEFYKKREKELEDLFYRDDDVRHDAYGIGSHGHFKEVGLQFPEFKEEDFEQRFYHAKKQD